MATNREVALRLRTFTESSPDAVAPKDRSSGNMHVRAPTTNSGIICWTTPTAYSFFVLKL